jgi:pyruvate/2-oxoglutarate dehydrogenase complex dihydrolipoamide dehydrogenase (E3) component
MVQQFAISIANKISPKDMHKVIFAHPTYSEGVAESILGLDNMALHLPKVNL